MGHPPAAASEGNGLAVATLALGVVALVLSPILLGAPLAVAGLVVGLVGALRRPPRRGMLLWGIGLSVAGLLSGAAFAAFYYRMYREWSAEWAAYGSGEDEGHDWVGMRAPPLKLSTLDGETVELAQFAGRPVVLAFWATWCPPCRAEIPHLERLEREVPEVVVLGISDEAETTLREFRTRQPIAYRVASLADPPAPFHGVRSLPTTVFVDRKGVIREVRIGLQEFDELRSRALGPEFTGASRSVQAAPIAAGVPLAVTERWSLPLGGVASMATCNWHGDAAPELLVQDSGSVLHVVDAGGRETAKVALPERYGAMECANGADGSARLLGYTTWGQSVTVLDATGRATWSYAAPTGVNGAHWGDLDGDGEPEMIVGFNGDGGLHAVGSGGRRSWQVTSIGNVWTQAVSPAADEREAVVAATEAGGSVRLFDGEGSQTAELRPLGDYYTEVDVVAPEGRVQVVAAGRRRIVAFDAAGTVAWQVERSPQHRGGFSRGDLAGDAGEEWVFPSRARQLMVVSAAGAQVAEVERQPRAPFAVLPAGRGPGLLVVGNADAVRAYALEPPPP